MERRLNEKWSIIARLITAVFLFVVLSPSLAVNAADDVSGNEADYDEEEVVDYITNYYTGVYTSYTGALTNNWDRIKDFVTDGVTVIQDEAERYDAIADYFRPHVETFVLNEDHKDFHGKWICDPSFMGDIFQDLTDSLTDSITDAVMMELPEKQHSGLFSYPELPPGVYLSAKDVYSMCSPKDSNWNGIADGSAVVATFETRGYYVAFATTASDYDSDSRSKITLKWYNGDKFDVGFTAIKKDGNNFTSFTNNGSRSMSYNYIDSRYGFTYGQGNVAIINGSRVTGNNFLRTVISGSTYISVEKYTGQSYNYYWNADTLNLIYIGGGSINYDNTEGEQIAGDNVYNIYNELDFDEYADQINELLAQINQQVTLNNQLTYQLLKKIGLNQYQPQKNDTLDDFWADLLSKLLDTATNGLPVVSPDLNGIAGALAALMNFLSSIVDAIGNIVSSLIEGLMNLLSTLFIPDEPSKTEINIQLEKIAKPVIWIGDFTSSAKSMFSELLLGDSSIAGTENSAIDTPQTRSSNTKLMNTKSGSSDTAPVLTVDLSNADSQYDFGGEVAILDLSWYAPYKPMVDPIIVALCWIAFIAKVFRELPGIISGASSSAVQVDSFLSKGE